MKKLVIALIVLMMLVPSLAFAERGGGILIGPSIQTPTSAAGPFGPGFIYGFEFGFIMDKVEIWPTLTAEMIFAQDLHPFYASLGADILFFEWLGIQPGITFMMQQDYSEPIEVYGFLFPQNKTGWGPSLNVSALVFETPNHYFGLRPTLSASYIFMEDGTQNFWLRFHVIGHIRAIW